MTVREFLHLPPPAPSLNPEQMSSYMRRLQEALQALRRGKTENVGEITLTASVASTTLSDPRISNQSVIVFHPRTANAAAELYGGTMYILKADQSTGSAVITHANNGQTDREFLYAVVG